MSTVEERAKAGFEKLDEFDKVLHEMSTLTPEVCVKAAKVFRGVAELFEKTALDPELIVFLNKRHAR